MATSLTVAPLDQIQSLDQALRCLVKSSSLFGRSRTLFFPSKIETLYSHDTRSSRIRELKVTTVLAIGLAFLTGLTDFALVPDLGIWPMYLRAGSLLPLSILFFLLETASDQVREKLLTLGAILPISVFLYIPFASRSSDAPYAYATASLALIYANCLFPLRCNEAIPTNCIFSALLVCLLSAHHMPRPLAFAIALQGWIAISFSLIGNYRIDRNARINYLLGSKDSIQQAAISADRDRFELLSNTDGLTGIANRSHFERALQRMMEEPSSGAAHVCFMMVDVDHFKSYNDTYGHLEGDQCLKLVASVLRAKVSGAKDLLARYGGEEFIILLHDISAEQAMKAAERIRSAVEHIPVTGQGVGARRQVTISLGLTFARLHAQSDVQAALTKSDEALYQSKANGRNRFTRL